MGDPFNRNASTELKDLKILVAEDSGDTAMFYKYSLEERGHQVTITSDGEECLKVYHEKLQKVTLHSDATDHIQPFDAVILDYNMPQMNGLEVAKEIFAVNRHQRIIFASAYLKDTLLESVEKLNRLVEVLNKPFGKQELIDTIDDKSIYSELEDMEIDIDLIKEADLRHEQLKDVLEMLRRAQKKKQEEVGKSFGNKASLFMLPFTFIAS
jgi:CheY-like chemotaxis protein